MYAFSFVLANVGIAIAASSPMMTTTINSSSSVNPVRFMRSLRLNRVRPKLRGRDNAATERRVVMLVSQRSCRGGHDRRQLATHHGHTPRAREPAAWRSPRLTRVFCKAARGFRKQARQESTGNVASRRRATAAKIPGSERAAPFGAALTGPAGIEPATPGFG